MWLGAGRAHRDAIVTLWATGVGAAIFTDGSIKSWQSVGGQDSFTLIATVEPMVWTDPNLLFQAAETIPTAGLAQRTSFLVRRAASSIRFLTSVGTGLS